MHWREGDSQLGWKLREKEKEVTEVSLAVSMSVNETLRGRSTPEGCGVGRAGRV